MMIAVDGVSETGYYYLQDRLGNVVALLNDSGAIVEAYSYCPFGGPRVHTAAGADGVWLTGDDVVAAQPGSAFGNPYMFTGRRWDEESGLYYYRARMYNPEIGRFLQPDPLMYVDGMNYYAYVNNNPVNWVDPWGEAKYAVAKGGLYVGNKIGAGVVGQGIAKALAPALAYYYTRDGLNHTTGADGSNRGREPNTNRDQFIGDESSSLMKKTAICLVTGAVIYKMQPPDPKDFDFSRGPSDLEWHAHPDDDFDPKKTE